MLDYCILRYELSRVHNRQAVPIWIMVFVPLNIKKKCRRIFWTTLTEQAFLLVNEFTQKASLSFLDLHPLIIIQIIDWRAGPQSRTQVGSCESPWRLLRSSSGGISNSKKLNLLVLLSRSQNDEMTKRWNDKQQNLHNFTSYDVDLK